MPIFPGQWIISQIDSGFYQIEGFSSVLGCWFGSLFYQTRSVWFMDKGSSGESSALYNFASAVTKFCDAGVGGWGGGGPAFMILCSPCIHNMISKNGKTAPSKWNWESSWCPLCCQWWQQRLLSGQMLVATVITMMASWSLLILTVYRNIPGHSQQVYSPHMAGDNLLCISLRGSIIQRCTQGAHTNHTMEAARLSLLTIIPKTLLSMETTIIILWQHNPVPSLQGHSKGDIGDNVGRLWDILSTHKRHPIACGHWLKYEKLTVHVMDCVTLITLLIPLICKLVFPSGLIWYHN